MNRFVRISSIALVTLAAGCASTEIIQTPGPSVPMVRLRPEPYSFTFNSGFDTQQRLVIRDPVTWQAVWNQLYSRQSPLPSLPAVDFSSEMIVVAALGARPTGGFSILLTEASETASGTAVTVLSTAPGPMCITTQAFTQPVDIARIPRRNGAVSFVEQSRVTNC